MDYVALIILGAAGILGGGLLLSALRMFTKKPLIACCVAAPVALFVAGFSLRLSEAPALVDTGFFLTDFSFLLTYLLFAMAFLVGQIRYWKKE